MGEVPHISVCVCTYQRQDMLMRLLGNLERQSTNGKFSYSVVVADNDDSESARGVVETFRASASLLVSYCCEPRKNIALVRNKALQESKGEFVALIDDDEFPENDWLLRLLLCCEQYEASGVLGPVKPHFEDDPPEWVIRGRFCERPEYLTGTVIGWENSRTGNALFKRRILSDRGQAFREQFGTGGEDKDFFMRMERAGETFVWCNDAVVHETVPQNRWTRRYMLRRSLLRGKNVLKLPGRGRLIAKSFVALPIYLAVLPFSILFGQHVFMHYCIRFCDHAGRLLAAIGLNPVNSR